MAFQIKELKDSHKSTFLIERATSRGFHLSANVINYWFSHGPRDMHALISDFEILADVMLVKKQLLTIPYSKRSFIIETCVGHRRWCNGHVLPAIPVIEECLKAGWKAVLLGVGVA